MQAASFSDWAAFLSLGLGISATVAIPFVGWFDADYLLVEDWQSVRDRVLVEVTNARHMACEARRAAAVAAVALLLRLSAPTAGGTR